MKLCMCLDKKRRSCENGMEVASASTFRSWDLDCFNRGYAENPRFWSRFGGSPCFRGLKVLDIGCGHGSLCVDIVTRGAKKVVGIDLKERIIQFANKNVAKNFPQLQKKLDFRCCNIFDVDESEFDLIVSKNAFEHILNLDKELIEMKRRLKQTGKIFVGFGPLFFSCFGDHGITSKIIPWGHLLIPRAVLRRMHTHFRLNTLSLKQYLLYFKKSGFLLSYFRVNADTLSSGIERAGLRVSSLLSCLSPLEKYFSCNLYCILENVG